MLTIQSHVVSGYVGNKCAVFPLQLHGEGGGASSTRPRFESAPRFQQSLIVNRT